MPGRDLGGGRHGVPPHKEKKSGSSVSRSFLGVSLGARAVFQLVVPKVQLIVYVYPDAGPDPRRYRTHSPFLLRLFRYATARRQTAVLGPCVRPLA